MSKKEQKYVGDATHEEAAAVFKEVVKSDSTNPFDTAPNYPEIIVLFILFIVVPIVSILYFV